MFTKKIKTSIPLLAVVLTVGSSLYAFEARAELTGNIGVHSKYLLRGIGLENNNTAVQGGVDYANENGFYAGWWGSNLGYTYKASTATTNSNGDGFENDLYAGFAGSSGDLSYKLGLIQYLYIDVDDSDLTEALVNVGYGPFNLQAQYLLNDGWWGNSGDIYWTANYSTALPSDFSLGASLGWYSYDKTDNAKLCNPNPAGCGTTQQSSAFRHLNLTLSHPVGNTGASMYAQYTVAGEDRAGVDYKNKILFGLTYGFDL